MSSRCIKYLQDGCEIVFKDVLFCLKDVFKRAKIILKTFFLFYQKYLENKKQHARKHFHSLFRHIVIIGDEFTQIIHESTVTDYIGLD